MTGLPPRRAPGFHGTPFPRPVGATSIAARSCRLRSFGAQSRTTRVRTSRKGLDKTEKDSRVRTLDMVEALHAPIFECA